MKIRFCVNNNANIHSKKVEEFTPSELGVTEQEWTNMTEDEKSSMAEDWANNYIEIWFEEIE